MRVTICGHAGLVIETEGVRVLVDPLFAESFSGGAIGFAPARRFDLDALGPVSLIVVSHGHPDHFHPATLEHFDRDLPVVTPDDSGLTASLRQLGFGDVTALSPWQEYHHQDLTLVATPSDFEGEDEIGILFRAGAASFWDTVDTIIRPELGRRLGQEYGPVGAVAARYQPADLLVSYQRTLGLGVDYKSRVIDWLECACATDPAFVFPYSFGVSFQGRHAWANRYAAPFGPDEVVRLLQARLGDHGKAGAVAPGDVLDIGPSEVRWDPQASPFVSAIPGPAHDFEPVDLSTLRGLDDPADAGELRERLEAFFVATLQPWLRIRPVADHVARLAEWGVVWQLAVHLGDGERLHYAVDFGAPRWAMERRRRPDANYFVHVDGGSLLQVLRGEAGSDLFWRCGAARFYEKILGVRDGRFWAPPVWGWDLFEQACDPLTLCLRKVEEAAERGATALPATERAAT